MKYKEHPDSWVVLKITRECEEPFYKVLVGWSGGYLDGDSWRMNSGITEVTFEDGNYNFYGYTGSCYVCHPESYGLRMSTSGVYNRLKEHFGEQIELMHKDTDWSTIIYE
jgi:hypothetical protein